MKHTKLFQVLSAFDKAEAKEFETFLEAAYFNTSDKLLAYYRILLQYHPDFDSPRMGKEKIYKKLHRNAAYHDQTMRDLSSSLMKLAKDFIAHQQLKKNQVEASNLRYEWMTGRGLRKMCEQEMAHRDTLLGVYSPKEYNYYYQRWLGDYNEFTHYAQELRDLEHRWLKKRGLDHHIHSLNKFYILRFLEGYKYLLSMARIYDYPMDQALGAHIDAIAGTYAAKGDPLIDLQYKTYQLLKTGEEHLYFELKLILFSNDASIPFESKVDASVLMENYCLVKYRSGDRRFLLEIVELFRFNIAHDLMLVDGKMSYTFYLNVVTLAVETDDAHWLDEFTEKYKPMLPAGYAQPVYEFAKVTLLFYQKKYKEALQILSRIKSYSDFQKADIKNMQARLHYELGMFDELNILLESYPGYLNNKNMHGARKEMLSSFMSYLKQILALDGQYRAREWDKLWKEINEGPSFAYKKWLMDKMEEMKTKRMPSHAAK